MSGLRRGRLVGLVLGLALVASGCAKDAPQDVFQAEGRNASMIDTLQRPVFYVAGIVFVLVMVGTLFIMVKFRARGEDDYDVMPDQVHGNFKLEIGWTILPALVLLAIAIPTVFTIFKLSADPPSDAIKVKVIGQQWWWEYRYDLNNDGSYDDLITANDLVMPPDREVSLVVESRDVIHSFWVPKLNGKRDAVPNRSQPWKLEADHTGTYLGQCTEYCGLSHANMRIKAVVISQAAFDKWAANQVRVARTYKDDDTSLEAQGYQVFNQQLCSSCHLINGVNNDKFVPGQPAGTIADPQIQVSRHAPNLTHLMTRSTFAGAMFDLRLPTPACEKLGVDWADKPANVEKCLNRSKLEAWLRNPPALKPMAPDGVPGRSGGRGMPNLNLSEDQIDQLVAYLVTLK